MYKSSKNLKLWTQELGSTQLNPEPELQTGFDHPTLYHIDHSLYTYSSLQYLTLTTVHSSLSNPIYFGKFLFTINLVSGEPENNHIKSMLLLTLFTQCICNKCTSFFKYYRKTYNIYLCNVPWETNLVNGKYNTQFIKYISIKGITLRLHPSYIHHLVPYRI